MTTKMANAAQRKSNNGMADKTWLKSICRETYQKHAAGHDQLRRKDRNFFDPATARPACRLKIVGHADAHSTLL